MNPDPLAASTWFDVNLVFRVVRFWLVIITASETLATRTTIRGINMRFPDSETTVLLDGLPQRIIESTSEQIVIDPVRSTGRLTVRITHRTAGSVTSINSAPVTPAITAPEYSRDGLVSVFFSGQTTGGCKDAAPGAVMTLYGRNLSQRTEPASTPEWPTALAGTRVLFNDRPIPLHLASPGQINLQIPFDATGTGRMRVESEGTPGPSIDVQIRPTAPCFLSVGGGPYVISIESTRILYATGFGVTNPSVPSGAPAPASPLARSVYVPDVEIGGQRAVVDFAGLAPGFVGLYQVNARIEQ